MSGLPSPSTSPIAIVEGVARVAKSTLAAKEAALILPEVEILRNTDIVLEFQFATTRSGLPSPSTSPIARQADWSPVQISTFGL